MTAVPYSGAVQNIVLLSFPFQHNFSSVLYIQVPTHGEYSVRVNKCYQLIPSTVLCFPLMVDGRTRSAGSKLSVVHICLCLTASLSVSCMTSYCFLVYEDTTHGEGPVHSY